MEAVDYLSKKYVYFCPHSQNFASDSSGFRDIQKSNHKSGSRELILKKNKTKKFF